MSTVLLSDRISKQSAHRSPRPANFRFPARMVWLLSGLNVIIVLGVLCIVFGISERWWVGTVLTYIPRAPWAIPSLLLIIAGLFWHRPSFWLNLAALLIVVGPLMEFRTPALADAPQAVAVPDSASSLRVVSANVQVYKPDFASLLTEVNSLNPDLVLFQEAWGDHKLLEQSFPEWHKIHVDRYWIASKFPVTLKKVLESEAFHRVVGIAVELDLPQGPVCAVNIHQMTARRGLEDLSLRELLSGAAQRHLEEFQLLRLAESNEVRQQINELCEGQPLLIAGDFNTPTSSSLFQSVWGDFVSSFDVAGNGFGYTSPVKPHRLWIDNLPWARIDHILLSPEWQTRSAQTGNSLGSDHHLIFAEVVPPEQQRGSSARNPLLSPGVAEK